MLNYADLDSWHPIRRGTGRGPATRTRWLRARDGIFEIRGSQAGVYALYVASESGAVNRLLGSYDSSEEAAKAALSASLDVPESVFIGVKAAQYRHLTPAGREGLAKRDPARLDELRQAQAIQNRA